MPANTIVDQLVLELNATQNLPLEDYEYLLAHASQASADQLAQAALDVRRLHFGNRVFVRGLIEVSSYCRNDCYYCGIRASNASCQRYRLTQEQILECAHIGHALGFRTLVLQGGEDPAFDDDSMCKVIYALKAAYPDSAVTLSLGERSYDSYRRLRAAGADRYLLRHETADAAHYASLHPQNMSFEGRMERIGWLRELGFAVGVGMMVGSPGQTPAQLAADLKFIEQFKPEMCGIGPFVPHHATPFAGKPPGSAWLTCLLLSVIRLIHPRILLPATTALGTIDGDGRQKGMLAGANVVMPNLSPAEARAKYDLYDNRAFTGCEAAEGLQQLERSMEEIGFEVVVDRGDPPDANRKQQK